MPSEYSERLAVMESRLSAVEDRESRRDEESQRFYREVREVVGALKSDASQIKGMIIAFSLAVPFLLWALNKIHL